MDGFIVLRRYQIIALRMVENFMVESEGCKCKMNGLKTMKKFR
jgi:hypothetical protein